MANLKVDLLNQIGNMKYYDEMEFIRLAQEPNMNYKDKIDQMQDRLQHIAILNAEISLVGFYIPDAPAVSADAPAPTKAEEAPVAEGQPEVQKTIVHGGQSHGE